MSDRFGDGDKLFQNFGEPREGTTSIVLLEVLESPCVKGHDFSRAEEQFEGGGFSRCKFRRYERAACERRGTTLFVRWQGLKPR